MLKVSCISNLFPVVAPSMSTLLREDEPSLRCVEGQPPRIDLLKATHQYNVKLYTAKKTKEKFADLEGIELLPTQPTVQMQRSPNVVISAQLSISCVNANSRHLIRLEAFKEFLDSKLVFRADPGACRLLAKDSG
ncbi:hypothetical protein KIN20_013419 [Parelaphostrongylus tenuis]|uniref:Uncharacterized protein n=1 Tax=Parelaphostrongylus tenuis TaxID=148309 RepID=A0AAD5QMK4_PARTN|nr:hypothetical protein KIN20_013419 [Parelaphostrongylus tenuis]